MVELALSFVVSCVVTLAIARTAGWHGSWTKDHDFASPQKIHRRAVPRIGGVAVWSGIAVAILYATVSTESGEASFGSQLLICSLPVAIAGLVEDLSKRVRVRVRLLAAAVSAWLAAIWMGHVLVRTSLWGLDSVVAHPWGAIILTVFAVVGICNAINIVDGLNGLVSMSAMLMFSAIAYVAWAENDALVFAVALAAIGGLLGFFLWNYPAGTVFLGDCGAYVTGFFVAQLCLALILRHPDISPLFALLICAYPVFETLFSIYRRKFLKSVSPVRADGLHLHSLIYRRVVRTKRTKGNRRRDRVERNFKSAPYLWALTAAVLVPTVALRHHDAALLAVLFGFGVFYSVLYWRIVRFKTPRWMIRS